MPYSEYFVFIIFMAMIHLIKTDNNNEDFIKLVGFLDAELAEYNGEDHSFYAQFNKIDKLKHVVVAYDGSDAVGCGAIKEIEPGIMEVKRMYVLPDCRGKGIATLVLQELETWATLLFSHKYILETGRKQGDAIRLYTKNGYQLIPNYGQYIGVDDSVCFEKMLNR